MEIEEKIRLNKLIRSYDGTNKFINDLKRTLKTSKYLKKEQFGDKSIKVLSDNQYEAFKTTL